VIALAYKLVLLALPGNNLLFAQVTNVVTYHNDNARTGQNLRETILTPGNVNATQFGKLYSVNVDGYVNAQPLVLTNVTIPGQGTHDVVYVATQNDSLYAIDAQTGSVLWQVSFVNPSAGVTTISTADLGSCSDVGPQIGITSTPVIDAANGTIFVVASTKENGTYVQRLHALDVATHAEKLGGPVVIQAGVSGTGVGSQNGSIAFDPLRSSQRSGLLLDNGRIVIAWGSHCDGSPYHGWIMSYNAGTLAQEAVLLTTPNGNKGGIWMGGGAVAAGANSSLYVVVSDGDFDGTSNWSDSVLKLDGVSLMPADSFTPYNQAFMQTNNQDLGSSSVLLLPDLPSGKQLLVLGSKLGAIYLLDRGNLGKYCAGCTSDAQITQSITGALTSVYTGPAYWNGNVYFAGKNDRVKAFAFNQNGDGTLSATPTSESPQTIGYPGTAPSVSANGNMAGIVWVLDNSTWLKACCQILRAYDAANLATELYNSSQAADNRDVPRGAALKFNTPTIANGKVYAGSQGTLSIYGLLVGPAAATPTFNPIAGTYNSAQSITLSDSSAGVTIYYTTNGTIPTTSSTVYTVPIPVSATTTIKAIAVGGGFSASSVATATYTIQTAAAKPTFNPVAGTYNSAQSITLSDSSAGVTIYYTTNGTSPTTSSTVYTAPIPVSTTTTVKAIAAGGGFSASSVATATYTIRTAAAKPTFSLPPGTYTWPRGTSISDTSPGVIIYYTKDGSTPTTSSTIYTGTMIQMSTMTTIKAMSAGSGFSPSAVASATYIFQAAKPTFSPTGGIYPTPQSVTISDSSPGVTIYYTTDGSTPTTSSNPYTSAIPVNTTKTIKAIAARPGFLNSILVSATYTIQ